MAKTTETATNRDTYIDQGDDEFAVRVVESGVTPPSIVPTPDGEGEALQVIVVEPWQRIESIPMRGVLPLSNTDYWVWGSPTTPFPTFSTYSTLLITSTDLGDSGLFMQVRGLDHDGFIREDFVPMGGTTSIIFRPPVYSLRIVGGLPGGSEVGCIGEITAVATSGGALAATISPGDSVSRNAFREVPDSEEWAAHDFIVSLTTKADTKKPVFVVPWIAFPGSHASPSPKVTITSGVDSATVTSGRIPSGGVVYFKARSQENNAEFEGTINYKAFEITL